MDSGTDHDSTCDQAYRQQPTRRVVLGIGIGLYLLTVGGLMGVLVERIRFDHHRASVLARYDTLLHARQETLMTIERGVAQRLVSKNTDPATLPGNRAEGADK